MLKKILLASLYVCCVYSKSDFFGDVKRAELFEETDNEIAVLRVTLPEDEFLQLKEEAKSASPLPGMNSGDGFFSPPEGGDFQFPGFGGDNGDGGFQFPGFGGNDNSPSPPQGGDGGNSGFQFPGNGGNGNFPSPPQGGDGGNGGFQFPGNGGNGNFPSPPQGGDGGDGGFQFPGFGDGGDGGFQFPGNGGFGGKSKDSFKTKNATMIVEINNKKKSFDKVTFAIGGDSTRSYAKQGYNIKIRGKNDLYGRIQIRLRPDVRDPSFIRSKLACDIHNRLGIPSVSSNYASLYINDEYMGFYVLSDSIKLSWIEYVFGEKDTTSLYQCKNIGNTLTARVSSTGCQNENEEVTDHTEWNELLNRMDASKTPEDVEDILDIDQFLTEIAYEYLAGSWDHYLNFGHNYYMYKPANSKWRMILYDFDADFGEDIGIGGIKDSTDHTANTFAEWTQQRHIIDVLILNNSTRFDNIVKNIVMDTFNPTVLFPHIDEIKKTIKPYLIEDKTPDENGNLPGRLNENIKNYSIAQWEANSEFTSLITPQNGKSYGLKYWILGKYRYICKTFELECDPTYMDESYEIPIDKEVEATSASSSVGSADKPNQPQPTETEVPQPTETDTTKSNYNCWAEMLGYSCCTSDNQKVYDHDENGDWGYDFINKEWCGLSPYVEYDEEDCWSEQFGYQCCKGCKVYENDEFGKWGYEQGHWCGIQSYCKDN